MKIVIIGHFGKNKPELVDGQTVKTRNLYSLLKDKYSVNCIDTYQWKKNPFKLLFKIINSAKKNTTFLILPDSNGVKVIPSLLLFLKKIHKIKIYYSVVGAWLPNVLRKNKKLCNAIKKLDGVLVETHTLMNQLLDLNLTNLSLVNNYKMIEPLKDNELIFTSMFNYVIFSRINKEKGVSDAIIALDNVRNQFHINITLDIYGPIENSYNEEFNLLLSKYPFVKYLGIINSDKSIDTIKNYYMLLFPTKYYTEGTPGTIIDSLFSGVPIIASDWASCKDIISQDFGLVYEFNNLDDLVEKIKYSIIHKEQIDKMKLYCLKEASKYSKDVILKQIESILKKD